MKIGTSIVCFPALPDNDDPQAYQSILGVVVTSKPSFLERLKIAFGGIILLHVRFGIYPEVLKTSVLSEGMVLSRNRTKLVKPK